MADNHKSLASLADELEGYAQRIGIVNPALTRTLRDAAAALRAPTIAADERCERLPMTLGKHRPAKGPGSTMKAGAVLTERLRDSALGFSGSHRALLLSAADALSLRKPSPSNEQDACGRGECQVMPDRAWMCGGCGGRFCAHHVCQECGAVFDDETNENLKARKPADDGAGR